MNKKIWIPKFNYYSKRLSMWQEKFWREVNGKPFMGILDNVAGRKYFEYATFGRSGVQQSNSKLLTYQPQGVQVQKMTACCVWNAANAIPTGPALTTQIDRGRTQFDATVSAAACYIYGYNFGTEGYQTIWGSFGVMDDTTYNDGGGTGRTIRSLSNTEQCEGGDDDTWFFALDGTSISNSDTTWQSIDWDNVVGTPVTTNRTDTTYTASRNGSTHWRDLTPNGDWTDQDANTDVVLTTG